MPFYQQFRPSSSIRARTLVGKLVVWLESLALCDTTTDHPNVPIREVEWQDLLVVTALEAELAEQKVRWLIIIKIHLLVLCDNLNPKLVELGASHDNQPPVVAVPICDTSRWNALWWGWLSLLVLENPPFVGVFQLLVYLTVRPLCWSSTTPQSNRPC